VEQAVTIECGEVRLEGLLEDGGGDQAAVVCHPHPLYGGDMNNNVVSALSAAYYRAGFSVLRFNFRGVGRSGGRYDNGRGEQDDLLAALSFLRERGASRIHIAGYSFGAWVAAVASDRLEFAEALVFVSPPVDFMDFSSMSSCPKLVLVITGERDELASPGVLERLVAQWSPDAAFHVIPGADHFYTESTRELRRIVEAFLKRFKRGPVK
jgi:hypothetical protein